jgi:CMP-N-acetylneuraminic acid synthetase
LGSTSVPFLRKDHADDISPVSEATLSALFQAENYWGLKYDIVVQLMPNCPIRNVADIVCSYNNFKKGFAPFQLSAVEFGHANPWWAFELDNQMRAKYLTPKALKMRSQDLPKLYCPVGGIWVANRDAFVDSRTFYGSGHVFFPINWASSIDIDTIEDLEYAKMVFQYLRRK